MNEFRIGKEETAKGVQQKKNKIILDKLKKKSLVTPKVITKGILKVIYDEILYKYSKISEIIFIRNY